MSRTVFIYTSYLLEKNYIYSTAVAKTCAVYHTVHMETSDTAS